jgi:hypothetical protein
MLMPIGTSITEHHEQVKTKYGEKASRTVRAVVTYRLAHASGEYIELQAAGEGQDSGDKATGKAMTAAMKWCLRQMTLVETGEDADRERPEADYVPPEPDADHVPRPSGQPTVEATLLAMNDADLDLCIGWLCRNEQKSPPTDVYRQDASARAFVARCAAVETVKPGAWLEEARRWQR